jgi:hypothetical protein
MKVLAYLLAVACAVVAVMYYVTPGGSLPIFMPGYNAGSTHIHTTHHARRRRRHSVRYCFVDRSVCEAMNFSPVAPRLSCGVLRSTNYLWITGQTPELP